MPLSNETHFLATYPFGQSVNTAELREMSKIDESQKGELVLHDFKTLVTTFVAAWLPKEARVSDQFAEFQNLNHVLSKNPPNNEKMELWRQQLDLSWQIIHQIGPEQYKPERIARIAATSELFPTLIGSARFLMRPTIENLFELLKQRTTVEAVGIAHNITNIKGGNVILNGVDATIGLNLASNAAFHSKDASSIFMDAEIGSLAIRNPSYNKVPENPWRLKVKGEVGFTGIGLAICMMYARLIGRKLNYNQTLDASGFNVKFALNGLPAIKPDRELSYV